MKNLLTAIAMTIGIGVSLMLMVASMNILGPVATTFGMVVLFIWLLLSMVDECE